VNKFLWLLSLSSLLHVSMVGGSDDCIKKKCRKGVLSPSIENNTLILPPCDECTNCTPSKLQTVQAWWYYKWPNGSRTDDIRATVVNESYEISVSCSRILAFF